MDGAREPWSGAWLVPFLLLSLRLLEGEAERFLLAYEGRPAYGVFR
jgi:hypothetical protein